MTASETLAREAFRTVLVPTDFSSGADLVNPAQADVDEAADAQRAAVAALLSSYGADIAAALPSLRHGRAARDHAREAANQAEQAATDVHAAEAHLVTLRGLAAARSAEREVLEAAVGAAAEEILRRLREAQQRVKEVKREHEKRQGEERAAHDRAVRASAAREPAEARLRADETARDAAAAALVRFAQTRLLDIAAPELSGEPATEWSTTRTVEVARRLEALFGDVDAGDPAWERTSKGLFAHVQTLEQALLPQGHQPITTLIEDLLVVEVPFQGRQYTMAEFGEVLAGEVTSRQGLLGAREREVLENHLVGEVSMHLHDRLHGAEGLVREMNAELAARPMSTGMTLRFAWDPLDDGPPGMLEARRRLMRAGGTWSPAEREALGTFLQQRIATERAANLGGSWQDHLARALDYRRWHRFSVERQQDGAWRRLTAARTARVRAARRPSR